MLRHRLKCGGRLDFVASDGHLWSARYRCDCLAGVIHAHHSMKMDTDEEALGSLMRLDDVCKPGNTLLWDLLQDDTAVSQ